MTTYRCLAALLLVACGSNGPYYSGTPQKKDLGALPDGSLEDAAPVTPLDFASSTPPDFAKSTPPDFAMIPPPDFAKSTPDFAKSTPDFALPKTDLAKPVADGNLPACSQGICAHSLCTTGTKLTSGCDPSDCATAVCAFDPYCCNSSWDSMCVGYIPTQCANLCTCT